MGRLTTPTEAAPEPADRARTAIGTALGIVYPTAVRLRDGRVWLTSRHDVLPAEIVQALEEHLSRRAADHAHDDRLLAEAVARLGAEVGRARGEPAAVSATAAVDRLLHIPDLDESRRREAEVQLRISLLSAARDAPEAAARLAAMEDTRPPRISAMVSASEEIRRDAWLLGAAEPARASGRHRAQVGGRHRRVARKRTFTREVRDTGLVTGAGGRPRDQAPLSAEKALDVLTGMSQVELSSSLTARPAVDKQAQQATVMMSAADAAQQIRVEVGPTVGGLVAQGRIGSGTTQDPHVLRLSPRLSDEQLHYVWTHQLSLMNQQIAAEKAKRSTGILGRLRSVFRNEGLDRRTRADTAAYQLLTRDWQQARAETLANGRPSGPRSAEDLEKDIRGLAAAIGRRTGTQPALPWTAEALADPDASAIGVAAARAQAEATPARHTPGHLCRQVTDQIQALEDSIADLDRKAAAKTASAEAAVDKADLHESAAQNEETFKDGGAAERARKERVDAKDATNKAGRHTEISGAYEQAAAGARHALAGYQDLLGALDANGPQARITELAAQAARRVEDFERSQDQAMPVKDALETGTPTGKPLLLPKDQINALLVASGSRDRIAPGTPIAMPGSEYRRLLSPDGMVLTIEGNPDDDVTAVTQVRLRMKARNVTEVIDRDYDLAAQELGTLGEGGVNVAATDTHKTTTTIGVNAGPFLALAAPGTIVHAASQVFAPRVEVATTRSLAETGGASAHHQSGWVEVASGESVLVEFDGELEVEVRTSPTAPWSTAETVDVGRQLTWVASPHTVKPAAETVSLAEIGRGAEVTGEFPRHTVSRINGVQSLSDQVIAQAQDRFGSLDRVTVDGIAVLINHDSYRLLRETSVPGGITRPIASGGESKYELTLETVPLWGKVKLDGESTTEVGIEEVVVAFAGANASQTYTAGVTGTGSVGSTSVDLSPSVSVGRNVSRQGGQNVSTTAITPSVQRSKGPTQGVLVGIQFKATLRKVGDRKSEPVVEEDMCEGRLRVMENDLLRAGGRADKDAVQEEGDGSLKVDKSGRLVLRGDPEPPTGPQHLPPWHGPGPNQLRGPGHSMVQNVQGADAAQRQALLRLSAMGLVPPLDEVTLRPLDPKDPAGRRTRDQLRRAAQQRNYDRIRQAILAPRLEADMNQACEAGIIVPLDDEALGRAPRTRMFRLSFTQDFDHVEPRGTVDNEAFVGLNVRSQATGRTSGRSKALPVSAGIGAKDGPAKGLRGVLGRLNVKFSRSALGKSISWTAGRRLNYGLLTETTGELDALTQHGRLTFAEITSRGDATPIADVPASYDVKYDTALTRADPPVVEANPKAPTEISVRWSAPVTVDAGNPADKIAAKLRIRPDSSAYLQLHAMLSPNSLVANGEWRNGKYELPMLPQEFKIVIRGEAVAQTTVARSEMTGVGINFAMTDSGFTSGTAVSGGVSLDGSVGPVAADGSGWSGGASVGRTGGTSQSTTVAQTTGEERLRVETGTHNVQLERYRMFADVVRNGKVVKTIPLDDALVQSAIPERRALELYAAEQHDLPVPFLADAAERYLTGKLELPPRTAQGFVRRYQQDKQGFTTGLAASHTEDRLAERIQAQFGVLRSHAASPRRLEATLSRSQKVADRTRVVHLRGGSHIASLGSGQVDWVAREGTEYDEVNLLEPLAAQVEEVWPGLGSASPLLEPALKVDLSPESFPGHLEDMLGPRGYVGGIEVPIRGQQKPDVLLPLVKAEFVGEVTVEEVPLKPDGTLDMPPIMLAGIDKKYNYGQTDRTVSHTTTSSGGLSGKGTDSGGGSLNGGVSTDRTRQHSAGSGELRVDIDGSTHDDMFMVKRTVVFTTRVVRLQNAGAAAMASRRWKRNRITPDEIMSVSKPRQVRAVLTTVVPRRLVADGPAPAVQAEPVLPEYRSFQLPESAVIKRAAPYLKGEQPSDLLHARIRNFLRRPDVLGEAGMVENAVLLSDWLKPTAMMAKFEQLTSADGYTPPRLAAPGNGPTTFEVTFHARRIGWEFEGMADGELTKARREQYTTSVSSSGNHVTPVTGTGGFDAGIVSVTTAVGEQVKQQSSNANGTRFETNRSEKGQMVSVRIPVEYDVTIREIADNGRSGRQVKHTTHLTSLAKGEFYVEMLKHHYLESLRQMETGASNDAALAEARLRPVSAKWGKPDLTASEYDEQGAYRPWEPLQRARAQAVATKSEVTLLMVERDGTERLYTAFPNGTMIGKDDGGFATAFGQLHRTMVQMAEHHKLPLRKLFNTLPPDASFSAKVAGELEKSGLPMSVLKGLDYGSTRRQLAQTPAHEPTNAAAGVGRTIAPTGHGSSLSGP